MSKVNEIDATQALEKSKNGAIFVDVRTDEEVAEVTYDVPNYIHIRLDELVARVEEIPEEQEVIMVCRSGARSYRATHYLMEQGYDEVFNLSGGIMAWVAKGFPSKRG